MKRYYVYKGIKIGIFFLGMLALASLAVQGLWNWLAPEVFGLGQITWIQALGLLALSRILFGSWGGGRRHRRHKSHKKEMWRKRWQERFEQMSEEDQEKWRQKFGRRGGKCGWTGDGPHSRKKGGDDKEDLEGKDPFTHTDLAGGKRDQNDNPESQAG